MTAKLPFLTAVVVFGVACGSDPVSGDGAWKLSCSKDNNVSVCTNGVRQFAGDDGTNGFSLGCRIEDRGNETSVYFSAIHGADYGIELRNAVITKGSATVANSGCTVRAFDDDQIEFTGTCGTDNSLTCVFNEINVDGTSINGSFKCMGMTSSLSSGALRDLIGPSGGAVTFRFKNCDTL